MGLSIQLLCAVVSGGLAHRLFFIRGEWHMQAPTLLRLYSLTYIVATALEVKMNNQSIGWSFTKSSLVCASHVISLFFSIVVYRLVFHGLRKLPGPVLASISKLWHVANTLDSHNYVLLEDLRRKYGNLVRTGPNEVTIFDPSILPLIYEDSENKFTKDVWYDLLLPKVSISTTRDKALHDHRRRTWSYGFTTKALENYSVQIQKYADQLDQYIEKHASQSINATQCFYWFSFDVMGRFAFSRSFDLLQNEQWDETIESLHSGMSLMGPLSPVPWLVRVIFSFSFLPDVRKWNRMNRWIAERLDERLERTVKEPDISHYLIEWSKNHNSLAADMHLLNGDAFTLIVAGSETVASTLVYIFYHLALHPHHLSLLRAELSTIPNVRDPKALQSLPHLNGVINETLRLWPPVPTGGLRQVPPEGIMIDGHFLAGGTSICAPRWSIGRLPSAFPQPHAFIPERWSSQPHLITDRRAYAPFSLGKMNCIGQKLAFVELRVVTALLVSRWDVRFRDGDAARKCIEGTKDCFSIVPGPLDLVFERRKDI